jgi:glutamyl-tRNA synthetase
LHIGGARTALFNWLLARRTGGCFILRIEDTDVDRNISGAEDRIREDLEWLGLLPDESPWTPGGAGPYRQSECLDEYNDCARRLIDAGHAYYAFDTADELDAMRAAARAEKRNFRYPRPPRFPTHDQAETARSEGRPVVVRMKAPDADVTVHDMILGDVTIAASELEDFVIVKANGWPTYHFAVVVDDARMNVTDVLRAQEHLMNTPKHQALQDALGFPRPRYAHVPIVMNMDGSKMSKRDKHKAVRTAVQLLIRNKNWTLNDLANHAGRDAAAAGRWMDKADAEFETAQLTAVAQAAGVDVPEIEVHDFRAAGYLPEAVLNFIALLGWSPGEDRERMTRDEMVSLFSVDRIGKTAAKFDREKLLAFNTDAAASAPPQRLRDAFRDYARLSGSPMSDIDDATLDRVLESCRGFRTFRDVDQKAGILFADDSAVVFDEKAVRKVLEKGEGRGYAVLEQLLPTLTALTAIEDWSPEPIDAAINAFAESASLKLGDVAQPLRVALCGRPVSPAIGETLGYLGRDKTINRINRCIAMRG